VVDGTRNHHYGGYGRYHFKIKEAKEKEMNKRILDQWEESPKELSDTNNEEGVGNPPIPPRETP
jgi:hypothetical protein